MEKTETDDLIFINGNVSSSKNGRLFNMAMKRSFPSKQTQAYIKESKNDYKTFKDLFLEKVKDLEKPYLIGFHFVRKSKHKYDFINPCQTIQDLMVTYGWLEDDNVTEMYPIPFAMNGSFTTYDKDVPGVFIKIIKPI